MEKSFEKHTVRLSMVRDLINQLAVIGGHCDLLSEHLKEGSQSAQRVCAIQEIAREMVRELNEDQCPDSESNRSATMPRRDVA
jgi:hypothetical protein